MGCLDRANYNWDGLRCVKMRGAINSRFDVNSETCIDMEVK